MKIKISLLVEIMNFNKGTKPHNPAKKQEKKDILNNLYALFEDKEKVLDAFENKIFSIQIKGTSFSDKVSDHSNLKILTLKQMLQRLPIVLVPVKAGNTSENVLNKIRKIYSLFRAKEITKKVHGNIMNSIKV